MAQDAVDTIPTAVGVGTVHRDAEVMAHPRAEEATAHRQEATALACEVAVRHRPPPTKVAPAPMTVVRHLLVPTALGRTAAPANPPPGQGSTRTPHCRVCQPAATTPTTQAGTACPGQSRRRPFMRSTSKCPRDRRSRWMRPREAPSMPRLDSANLASGIATPILLACSPCNKGKSHPTRLVVMTRI